MKKQGGITLIALVVTIIVLLILAGVSIAMLTGQNGILNRATEAGWKTKLGEAEDIVGLTCGTYTADYLSWKYTDSTTELGWTSSTTDDDVISKACTDTATSLTGDGATFSISYSKPTIRITYTDKAEKTYTVTGTVNDKGNVKWGTKAKGE